MDSAKAIASLRATVDRLGPAARLNTPVTITLDQARVILGHEASVEARERHAALLAAGVVGRG